jgi:DNA polymerase III subunit epsilon
MQAFVDPEREIDAAASEVHGKTWDDLKGKPRFADVAAEFIDFARGATWIIHNAAFDVGFLDKELGSAGLPACAEFYGGLIDTLALARDAYPGKRNNLDALCERFGVSNAHRTLHGALLDAQLLAEVYLAMTRGQESLTIDMGAGPSVYNAVDSSRAATLRAILVVLGPTPDELRAHDAYLAALERDSKGKCLWLAAAAA